MAEKWFISFDTDIRIVGSTGSTHQEQHTQNSLINVYACVNYQRLITPTNQQLIVDLGWVIDSKAIICLKNLGIVEEPDITKDMLPDHNNTIFMSALFLF